MLKTQLDKANDEKGVLMRLLDQQQQLSLSDRNKIKVLEIELEEFSDFKDEKTRQYKKEELSKHETKKPKWYEFSK